MTAPTQSVEAERNDRTVDTPEPERSGSGLRSWWLGLSRPGRAVVAVVGAIVAVNIALSAVEAVLVSNPGGPTSSSRSTGGDGLEALADLVAGEGARVVRVDEPLDDADLASGATVVVADPPTFTEADAIALGRHLSSGGRVVMSGAATTPILQASLPDVDWFFGDPTSLDVWIPSVAGGAERLAGDEGGRWEVPAEGVPIAGARDGASAFVVSNGGATVVAIADTAVLQNDHLAEADNAAFALGVLGVTNDAAADGLTVAFVESVHDTSGQGWSAIPSAWSWLLAGSALVALVGVWWLGTRFGPPEPDRRRLRPARVEHVNAVAATLGGVRTGPADDTEGLWSDDPAPVNDDEALEVARRAARRQRARFRISDFPSTPDDHTPSSTPRHQSRPRPGVHQ